MDDINKIIGGRIKHLREKVGLNQAGLGVHLGVGKTMISKYEAGAAKVTPEALAKIAEIGKVSLDWLVTGKNGKTAEHSDQALESAVNEHAAGWECKGEEFSETEQRIIGMLRRLTPEMRQVHFDGITTSYFNQMEREIEAREKKD